MRSIPVVAVLTIAALGGAGMMAAAQPASMPVKIERVALFKNGLGYFASSGTLPGKATTVSIGQLPVPSFGTFWVGYDKDVKMRALVSSLEDTTETAPVQSVGQLLLQNIGRKVSIRTGAKEDGVIVGVILKSGADARPLEPPNPYFMDVRGAVDPYGRPVPGYNPQPGLPGVVAVKTDQGVVTLSLGSIVRADFEGDGVATVVPVIKRRPTIRMELEKEAGGEQVGISYLARGITWLPSYRIDLSDGKTATFSAQALIVNEVADLDNVSLELITGFPNIKFAELASPVAMTQDLAEFLTAFASEGSGRRADRYAGQYMMTQQAMIRNVSPYDGAAAMPSYSTAAAGTVSEDLFLYPLKGVTMKKGETACMPLFSAEIPFQHVYTWQIDDLLDENESYRNRRNDGRPDGKMAEEVWHSCRFSNSMKMPLTTAAAEFVKEGQFVGQDVCHYTAPGAETTIRINRAMNVLAEQTEFEVERKRSAANFFGCQYDLVKVRGEMKIRNLQDKPVTLEITKELSGEVLEKTPDAKDRATAKGLRRVNPKHVLVWTLELKSAEDTTAQYVYQVYVRN